MPFFSDLAPSANVVFAVTVSKHLLESERQQIILNNSDMEMYQLWQLQIEKH
jgi:hypothetical protein